MISVIVPIYNGERFIDGCIESILAQSYDAFELVCVDDGSTDSTREMLDAWAERDGRIRVVDKPHGGLASTRNVGLDAARGEFISFVDVDDRVHPEYLARLFSALIATGADISLCHHAVFSDLDDPLAPLLGESGHILSSFEGVRMVTGPKACEELNSYFPCSFNSAWGKLYKAELFEGLRYPEEMFGEPVYVEDFPFCHRILMKAKRIAHLGCYLYAYCGVPRDALTRRPFELRHRHLIQMSMDRLDFLRSCPEATQRSIDLAQDMLEFQTVDYFCRAFDVGCFDEAFRAWPIPWEQLLDLCRKYESYGSAGIIAEHIREFHVDAAEGE